MKNIWTKACHCLLAIGMWLVAAASPLAASEISATYGCDCGNADNYESGGNYYFAETVVIEGAAGDTWTLNSSFSIGLLDASATYIGGPLTFTETSPGTYELSFWHLQASGYGIHVSSAASGEYLSINGVCFDHCNTSCDMDGGLLINDCVSDDRFTFSLDPSGAGFSGTYNLTGAVSASGITGAYNSPPLLSTEGDYSIVITDANDPSCGTTVTIPPPACAALSIGAFNNCDCEHEDNYELNSDFFFAETVVIVGDPGDTWTVDMDFTVGLYDGSGNLMTGPLAFTETVSGVYTLDFWYTQAAGFGLHTYDSAGDYGSLNVYCPDTCPSLCSIDNDGLLLGECLPGERFTFSLNPSGANFSGTYHLSGDVNASGVTGAYTSLPVSADGNLNITITDANNPNCTYEAFIPAPSCASDPCSIDDPGVEVGTCTPADRFVFTLNPSGLGFSGTYNLSGDVNVSNVTGVYTSPPALTNVGDINVTIRDAANPFCQMTVFITPPDCNSNGCSIDDFNLVVHDCTPDGSRFTFTFEPTGTNFSGTYNLSGDINLNGVTGAYTSPPALTGVGLINVKVTDAADPSCSRTLYVAPPACATAPETCSIDNDGLLVNDCLPDGRFTFTLNPSGAGFSGVYNMSGDVNVNGATGAYTSPPALSDVGNLNVTIRDAANPSCQTTVFIPPPACNIAAPVIAAGNGCNCTNSDNYELNGAEYMAENVGIISAAGDTWTVDLAFSVGLTDASGNALSGALTFTETSPGLYEFPFWHKVGAGYGVHAYNSAGEYLSLNGVCLTSCNAPGARLNTHDTGLAISEVYPNPTKGGIVNVVFNSEASDNARLIVFNVFGQQKMVIPVTANKGANLANIYSNELPIGTYFIAIESNNERSAPLRFVKVE